MNERERILNLLKDGRITSDEAALLMDALEEVETPSRGRGFGIPPVPPVPPVPPIPPIAQTIANAFAREFGHATDVLEPPNLKWIRVHLISEDLEVKIDPTLDKPYVEGDVQVNEERGVITVSSNHGSRRGNRGQFSGVHWNLDFELGDDPVVRLPEGWGLACNLASGDLNVEGVAYVRGSVASGDVSLEAVRGVDLRVMSGDLEATLILTEGNHRLELMSGDAEIVFVDSSVRVEGKLSSGDLDPRGNFTQQKRKISGQVGEGKALLQLVVSSGDLTLEDRHGRD